MAAEDIILTLGIDIPSNRDLIISRIDVSCHFTVIVLNLSGPGDFLSTVLSVALNYDVSEGHDLVPRVGVAREGLLVDNVRDGILLPVLALDYLGTDFPGLDDGLG